ncbi:MAG: nuclear transport factor 2 family protein [Gemmatimonadota bacterium]|nr:nuclear transport factor 2 family protein [Gemmatimonadota bacterium]
MSLGADVHAALAAGRAVGGSVLLAVALVGCEGSGPEPTPERDAVEALVHDHARAWMTGDTALLRRIMHPDARLAYPRRRVDRETWIEELAAFHEQNVDTRVYVHRVVVEDSTFAVEWQFATTERESGARTAVGDAIIGEVRDGRIVLWKEYLDGRIFALQRSGELPLDEGEEPYPWPRVP